MFQRLLQFPPQNSCFLFGARGAGKTHFIRQQFHESDTLYLDLLDPELSDELILRPGSLQQRIDAAATPLRRVVIDEVQKAPRLLDVVHHLIETTPLQFILTGSSARKLRRGAANLLAGRAFERKLYPLTARELGGQFDLKNFLEWGSLPRVTALQELEKRDFLKAYTHTYLKEEIISEQLVRRLDPFRRFIHVAAQMSGQIINYTKIAREIGSNPMTVRTYFEILEDTHIGTLLEPYHQSIRKRQSANPKFYLFDSGVIRTLTNTLGVELRPNTYAFGQAFEHFLFHEIRRLAEYAGKDYRFSFFRTQAGVEVDLIVERPGAKTALLEFKSSNAVTEDDVRVLNRLISDFDNAQAYCLSLDPTPKRIDQTLCLKWDQGIQELGL